MGIGHWARRSVNKTLSFSLLYLVGVGAVEVALHVGDQNAFHREYGSSELCERRRRAAKI